MNVACENDAHVHVGKFVDCSAFAEAANRPYINILYANSLWCTDSRWIAFGCLPNIRHTAECCLPRLRNTSTSNVRILFAFRCKRGFIMLSHSGLQWHHVAVHLTEWPNLVNCINFDFILSSQIVQPRCQILGFAAREEVRGGGKSSG